MKENIQPRLIRSAPMLRVALGMMAGILVGEMFVGVSWVVLLVVAAGCLLSMALHLHGKRGGAWTFPLSLWMLCFCLGWAVALYHTPPDPLPAGAANHEQQMLVELRDTPHATPRGYKVPAEVMARCEAGGWHPTQGRIMLFVRCDSAAFPLIYGNRMIVGGSPMLPSSDVGPNHFDYRKYLLRHGIRWQCFVRPGQWKQVAGGDGGFNMVRWSKQLQCRWVRRIQSSHLTLGEKGIAEAMLLGWRDDVDDSTWQRFGRAGITHLLCVSGLHVGILAMLVGACLTFLGVRRWQRIVKGLLQLAAIWFFVLLTGCGNATLRAGIMFSLLLIGEMFRRRSCGLNNLATSAVLMLLFKPALLFDVGFQLSYTAVLGILLWQRPLHDLLPFPEYDFDPYLPTWKGWGWSLIDRCWQWVCLSTAAQLATLPLVLYHFHQFPSYFLIANITIVPLAGLLLCTIMLQVATVGVPLVGPVFASLLHWELRGVDILTRWVSGLPHALPCNIRFDLPEAFLLTLILLLFTLQLRHRKAVFNLLIALLLLLLALYRKFHVG